MTISYRYLAPKSGSDVMAIAGRGLRVYTLFSAYEMGEAAAESLAKDRDLPLAAVFEALAYAYDHPDEMAKIRAADEEAEKYALSLVREDLRRVADKTREDDDRAYEEAVRQARAARIGIPQATSRSVA